VNTVAEWDVRVLLIDDDEDDYLITRDMLEREARMRFTMEWAAHYDDALAAIREQRHDVYLVDYHLGERTGLELIREGFASRPSAPVIMLTGQATYEIDLEATALGVTDFLVKQELDASRLERSIRYAISHQKAERYALAVRAANDGIWDWNLKTDRIYLSPRWHAILGQPEEARDELPSAWFDLVAPDDLPHLRNAIEAHLEGRTQHLECEHRMRHADGGWRWVMIRGVATRDVDGRPTRMAGSLSDMTDRRITQLRLEHEALHDTLTGLPNRTLFLDRANQILRRNTREPGAGCAVLFLDLDGFKLVNDSLSHAVGDQLLVALADRVVAAVRPGDTVARLGGDEFIVLLDRIVDPVDATVIAERILRSLVQPFDVDGHELFASASIGISLSAKGLGAEDLIRNADIAMYEAKRRGRARSAVFDATMHQRVVDRLARQNEVRQLVENSLLRTHYQPIVELATGRVRGLEALARWPLDLPPLEPSEFISIAEETGLINSLGQQIMRNALHTLAAWRDDGLVADDVSVSVNLSIRQLDDPSLAEQVRAQLADAGLPPEALKLEITESTLMQEAERTDHVFAELRATGVSLQLDDFGTGYSSLTALHRLPVDALKIDRSFVASILAGDGSEVIVRSTVALAHSLDLPVIAEGIEDPRQLSRLRALGCEYGQGALFSSPAGEEEMRAWLERWDPAEAVGPGAGVDERY
jgi:diguanylate cyclase (GGDEF)-like protein/PAS domain S-box-containing protein